MYEVCPLKAFRTYFVFIPQIVLFQSIWRRFCIGMKLKIGLEEELLKYLKLKDLIVKKMVLLLNFYSQNTKYPIKQSRLN